MTLEEACKIHAILETFETNEPDTSFCRLLQMTADAAATQGLPVQDDSGVVDALAMVANAKHDISAERR
jgi:hypothetical protein